jgi:hypothetical protein
VKLDAQGQWLNKVATLIKSGVPENQLLEKVGQALGVPMDLSAKFKGWSRQRFLKMIVAMVKKLGVGPQRFQFVSDSNTGLEAFVHVTDSRTTVCFRGTERSEMKDVVTSVKFLWTKEDDDGSHTPSFTANFCYMWHQIFGCSMFSTPSSVHRGFAMHLYDSQSEIHEIVDSSLRKNPAQTIVVTGHSLGGAVANLYAYRLAKRCPEVNVQCYTFGSPRVGNIAYAKACDAMPNLTHIRTKNEGDLVTMIPSTRGACHSGSKLWIEDGSYAVLSSDQARDNAGIRNSAWFNLSKERLNNHFMNFYIEGLEAAIARAPNQRYFSSNHASEPTETPAPAFTPAAAASSGSLL